MSDGDSAAPIRNPQSANRNRNWVWFFAALAVLSVAAVSINLLYNRAQQLTPERLQAAQDQWDRGGLRDYDLAIEKTVSSAAAGAGEDVTDRITVAVRGGQARLGMLNGQPLEPRVVREYDMAGWLAFVEEFL